MGSYNVLPSNISTIHTVRRENQRYSKCTTKYEIRYNLSAWDDYCEKPTPALRHGFGCLATYCRRIHNNRAPTFKPMLYQHMFLINFTLLVYDICMDAHFVFSLVIIRHFVHTAEHGMVSFYDILGFLLFDEYPHHDCHLASHGSM